MSLDNIELDNLAAGDDVATDLVATDHYQIVKLAFGAAGTVTDVVSTGTTPFPVALSDVDNTVLDNMATDLAAIEVTQDALVVDAAAMEVLLTNIDSDTNTIQSDTTAILADTASIQTAVELIDDAVHADAAAYVDGSSKGIGCYGVHQSTPDTVANDDFSPILLNATAGQMVELQASTASIGVVDLGSTDNAVLDAMVVDLAAIEVTQDALVVDAAAMEVLLTNIDSDTNTIQSDTTAILADTAAIDNNAATIAGAIHADSATYTDSTSTGIGMFGVHQATPDTVADNDFSPILLNATAGQMVELQASTASIGVVDLGSTDNAVLDSIVTNQSARATGGMSFHMLALAAEDNDVVIKASAATVYFISVQSIDATPVYLKLFNLASFTPGTSTADLQFICPSQGDANGAGITLNFGDKGIQFGTGLCALIATGIALDDNTAVSINEVVVTIGYE